MFGIGHFMTFSGLLLVSPKTIWIAGAQRLFDLEPQWDTEFKTPNCAISPDTTEFIHVQGSTSETCSVQVKVTPGIFVQLQISNEEYNNHFFIYIDTNPDYQSNCSYKYVVFTEPTRNCSVFINHKKFRIFVEGNTTVSLRGAAKTGEVSQCLPKNDYLHFTESSSKRPSCSGYKLYNDKVSCIPDIDKKCIIRFPSNCSAFLGYSEISYKKCYFHSSSNFTVLINYRIRTRILDLSRNNIVYIDSRAFYGLPNLQDLHLNDNHLTKVDSYLFSSSINMLQLNFNKITAFSIGSNSHMAKLKHLSIASNLLSELSKDTFHNLSDLEIINMNQNQIRHISSDAFLNLNKLMILRLCDNLLTTIPKEVFQNLQNLQTLYLCNNKLIYVQSNMFLGMDSFIDLRLNGNKLETLHCGLFHNVINLKTLNIDDNQIANLPGSIFTGLRHVRYLFLDRNVLAELDSNVFHDLTGLIVVSMKSNRLVYLPNTIFTGLIQLQFVILSENYLSQISGVFDGLTNLLALSLKNNTLKHLEYDVFKDTVRLTYLDLSGNQLNSLPRMDHFYHLKNLDVTHSPLLWISNHSFEFLPMPANVLTSQHEVCECYIPAYVNCSAADRRSPYLTCKRLLSDRVHVVIMWLIGLGALSGNLFVLGVRQRRRKETNAYNIANHILLQNLAASDLLMGIYMLIIASADVYFGDNFPMQSEAWRSGTLCRIAGALSITSSEASVFFITLMSIDRFNAIKFPYSLKNLRKTSAKQVAFLTWILASLLGVIPSILSGYSFKFYDNSHVCIGLPLALTKTHVSNYASQTYTVNFEKTDVSISYNKDIFHTKYTGLTHGLFFSTVIFLGLNLVCLVIILFCYIEIFKSVKKSSEKSGRSREMKEQIRLTTKVTAIVATDFFCWFPIITLGILVQARIIDLPVSVYAWCVTFVMPINSAVNPYLYTIAEVLHNYRRTRLGHEDGSKPESSILRLTNTKKSCISLSSVM